MPRKKSSQAADSEQLELPGAEPSPAKESTKAKAEAKTTKAKSTKAKKTKKAKPPLTTAQQLGSILKSCRDIMRKDKGLNGDTDRLPMLTWIMFLKFLDDVERLRETEALLAGESFKAAIAAPYRWRDWAANAENPTGDELINFIQQEEAVLPDGSKGLGLFAYLRSLQGADGKDRRDVIATVFKGAVNRMINGYLLRDVVNKINEIQFQSTEEIHTLGRLYESMLKEMRDAAGDSGEFYTPRPVVQFMVQVLNPQLGETLLDPACGTGGFLLEAFEHLKPQCETVADREILQQCSVFGGEAKPLPYLLAQMNLLLHGLELPEIDAGNSLRHKLVELGDGDRVDIILTNPPFGGEEEKGIQGNFPPDKQTSETALLFLQLIMRLLKRKQGSHPGGRAGVVVPNGTLFGDGVCARIKEQLLKDFNLHTIVRLPNGTFAPYTSIPTNLLFFERGGPTEEIWYYEQPLPEGRKNYTKTKPLRFEELRDCLAWWQAREENDQAWKVPVAEVLKYNEDGTLASVNLDVKNPRGTAAIEHRPPAELVASIQAKEQRILELSGEILAALSETGEGTSEGAVMDSEVAVTSTGMSIAVAVAPDLPVARRAADAGYGEFVADVVALLEAARGAVARSVNAVMTALPIGSWGGGLWSGSRMGRSGRSMGKG